MAGYYIMKDGLYLAVRTNVSEDDYWEVSEIDAAISTQVSWVVDPLEAKEFDNTQHAQQYIAYHRYRGCEVVRVRL